MKRITLGVAVFVHGLGHASAGVWAAGDGPLWMVTVLWGVAMLGYLAAGLGMLRVPVLRDHWKPLMVAATASSIVLLASYMEAFGVVGIILDVALLVLASRWAQRPIDADVAFANTVGVRGLRHPLMHRIAWTASALFLAYAMAVVLVRPTYLRWGTTSHERIAALVGDDRVRDARYRVDHAITIRAPVDSVWPWLVQLGQDRGGFYSYAWLERLFGDDIRNADRIHPEWQQLAVGDTIRATQTDYLGGRFGTLGWRVGGIDPGRALILERWGAFVLVPVDSATTRFVVRMREEGSPSILGVVLGPFNVFVFEPAHFIMQRGMLRGVRDRAEARSRFGGVT